MKSFIRNLSAPAEFCLVVFVTFWWGLLSTAVAVASRLNGVTPPMEIYESYMALTLVFELAGLAAALWIGRIRRWSLETFGWRPSWKRTGTGLLLTLGSFLVAVVVHDIFHSLIPETIKPIELSGSLSLPLFLLMSFINPVFEEVIETGYFIHVLQRHGIWVAVIGSAFFRTLLHAYQGVYVFVDVFPFGLIFGFVYWRWRQLWPLFVAHVIFDVLALLPLVHR